MLTTKDNTRLLATAGKGNESAQAMQSKKIEDQQKSEKTKLIKAQIKCEQFEIKSQESDLTSTEKKEMDNNQKVRDQMLDKYSAYKEMNSEEMIKTYEDEFKESFTGNISAIEYDKEPGKKSLEELYEEKEYYKNIVEQTFGSLYAIRPSWTTSIRLAIHVRHVSLKEF